MVDTHVCSFCGSDIFEEEHVWLSAYDGFIPVDDPSHCPDSDNHLHEPDLEAEADEEKDRQDEAEMVADYGLDES